MQDEISMEAYRLKDKGALIPAPSLARCRSNQPDKALHVAIVIHHLSKMKKSSTISLSSKMLQEFGVLRNSTYRALRSMEAVGLVSVQRAPGRQAVVTITAHQSSSVASHAFVRLDHGPNALTGYEGVKT
jgi:hypothetical protein